MLEQSGGSSDNAARRAARRALCLTPRRPRTPWTNDPQRTRGTGLPIN